MSVWTENMGWCTCGHVSVNPHLSRQSISTTTSKTEGLQGIRLFFFSSASPLVHCVFEAPSGMSHIDAVPDDLQMPSYVTLSVTRLASYVTAICVVTRQLNNSNELAVRLVEKCLNVRSF